MLNIIEHKTFIEIGFAYHPNIKEDVKKIPGSKFDFNRKTWTIPRSENSIHGLQAIIRKYGIIKEDTSTPESYEIQELPELEVEIPLKRNLFPYQRKGVAYGLKTKRVIIGDQPGLGKTGQAIAIVKGAVAFPCLIICPSSIKINWQREWELWTDVKALVLEDKIKNTWPQYFKSGLADVFIVNYESLKKYFVESIEVPKSGPVKLNNIKFKENINLFKSVIIDESHRCKDSRTQQAKFVKGLANNKEYVLALTGTPVVNKPKDLVAQLSIIDRLSDLGGFKFFMNRYCGGNGSGAFNLKELNYKLTSTCFYRRDKKEVLKDLPAKMRQVVLCEIDNRKEYSHAISDLEDYLKKFRSATDEQVQKSMKGEIMVRIGILKNISAKGKLKDVFEYVDDIMEQGEKLVLFIHLREVAEALLNRYPKAVTIRGGDDNIARQQSVDSFQNNPSCQLIICSIKAAGVGITLTAASRVAFVELPWHAADTEQCEDRCILEGELIMTPNGWVPIEKIEIGDKVINRFGAEATVVDAWNRANVKPVTEIDVEGWGIVKTTHDHMFLTNEDIKWKEASKLFPGMMLAMPFTEPMPFDKKEVVFDSDCRIDQTFIGNRQQLIKNGKLIIAPDKIQVTDDFLFTCGYFAGDGFASTKSNKGRFISFAGNIGKKQEPLSKIKAWIESVGLHHNISYGSANGCEIRAYSGEWAYFFKKHFGKNVHDKRLPEFLMNLNRRQSRLVLNGLMASDGYFRNNRFEFVTCSNQLAVQVFSLAVKCGFKPTVSKNTTGQHVIAYAYKITPPFAKVRSVKTYFPKKVNGKRQRVYDLTTDDTESFVLGISVVHNCHRIGQKDSVQCIYFLGRQTIDEKIYKLIDEKREVANTITGAKNDVETNIIDSLINLL